MITFTVAVVDNRPGESRNEGIVRRLAGELGQRRLSASEVARRTGMTQAALSRRMTGQVTFSVDELELICATIGMSFEYIATGARQVSGSKPDDDSLLPWHESNMQLFDLRSA